MRDEAILSIRELTRSFGEHVVLSELSLEVNTGERVAVRGPNGSGKSTLLRCVAGTVTPSRGEVRVAAHPAGTLAARRLIGAALAQERSFYLRISGRSNLVFYARLRGASRRAAAREVAGLEEELDLAEIAGERVDRCSTGMVQQLAFARALLGSPRLLVLDEPTRSLDDAAVGRFWTALGRRPDCAALIATHSAEDVAHCGGALDLAD